MYYVSERKTVFGANAPAANSLNRFDDLADAMGFANFIHSAAIETSGVFVVDVIDEDGDTVYQVAGARPAAS